MAANIAQRASPAVTKPTFAKPALLDAPVSNNGGRCRFIIYKKKLQGVVDILSPKVLGGVKSEAYLELNPQGLMPLLCLEDGTSLPESAVIASYLADRYADHGPSFRLGTPEERAHDLLVQRIHDLYLVPIQGCMYRQMEAPARAKSIERMAFHLDVLNSLIKGPYVNGESLGLADAALFPTLTFCRFILGPIFGWEPLFDSRPGLGQYWAAMEADEDAARVIGEIEGALQGWKEADRWQERGISEQVADKQWRWSY